MYAAPAHVVVADTILSQIGGNRFLAMTGAKNLTANGTGLTFRLPANFAKNGINVVRIDLTPADDYTVTFYRVRGTKVTTVETVDMVHADNLRRIFTMSTGLDCTL